MVNTRWRRTLPFCVCAFSMDTVSGIYLACLPFLAKNYGAGPLQLGYLDAFRSTAYAVFCLLGSYVFQRHNRKLAATLSCLGLILALVATWTSGSLAHVYLAVFIWSVTLSLFWPAVFAWLGDTHDGASLGPACSAVNLSWSMGIMAGSAIGGWLFKHFAQSTFALAIVPVPLIVLLVLLNPHSGASPHRDQERVAQAGSWLTLLSAYTGNVAVCVLLGVLEAVFPALDESIGFDVAVFGLFMAGVGCGRITVFALGMWRGRLFRSATTAIGTQVCAALMLMSLVTATHRAWIALIFLAVGLALGANYYRGLFLSLEFPGGRALKTALHEGSLILGILVGSLGGGVLADRWGDRAPYVPLGICALLLAACQVVLIGATRLRVKGRAVPVGGRPPDAGTPPPG